MKDTKHTPNEERQLIEAVANGDADALREIVERHQAMVYRTCLRLLRNEADAEDAAQATFIVFHKKCGELPRGTVLGGWLYRTAGFVSREFIRSAVRRKRREEEAGAMNESSDREDAALWNALQPVLDGALLMMPGKYREVVVLRYLEGKSTSETADLLGLSTSAVTTRLARALDRLRALFRHRGIAVGAVALSSVLAENAAAASVPATLAPSILATAGPGAAAGSVTAGLMAKGALAKMGSLATHALGLYLFVETVLCTISWVKDGYPIPRWVHIFAVCLFAAGLLALGFLCMNGLFTVLRAALCLAVPPAAAYMGWLWMCGPAHARK